MTSNSRQGRARSNLVSCVAMGCSLLAISACLAERHLVGDGLPDAEPPSLEGSDAGPSSTGPTVVSLGDKISLGWSLAISPEEIARRLSQLMLQKAPSGALTAAVVARAPLTNQDVGELADGLLLEENSLAGRQAFYRWWLDLDQFTIQPRDAAMFPTFNSGVAAALVAQTLAFVEDVTWQPSGNLTTLLTRPEAFATSSTAPWFSNVIAPGGTSAGQVTLDPTRYAGIVTQPAVVATHDLSTRGAPSRRGRDVRSRFLCQTVPPPPITMPTSLTTAPNPGATFRERLEDSTGSNAVCTACHSLIDPLGFAFGHFDAVGAFHETDGNAQVDTTGTLTSTTAGASVPFSGAPELVKQLAELPEARACYATHWLAFAIGAFRNGVVAPAPGTDGAPRYGPVATDAPPWSNTSLTFDSDVDYIVKRATVQGELNLRGTLRAVTETHSFLDP